MHIMYTHHTNSVTDRQKKDTDLAGERESGGGDNKNREWGGAGDLKAPVFYDWCSVLVFYGKRLRRTQAKNTKNAKNKNLEVPVFYGMRLRRIKYIGARSRQGSDPLRSLQLTSRPSPV